MESWELNGKAIASILKMKEAIVSHGGRRRIILGLLLEQWTAVGCLESFGEEKETDIFLIVILFPDEAHKEAETFPWTWS